MGGGGGGCWRRVFFPFFYSKSSDPRPREGYRGGEEEEERGEPPSFRLCHLMRGLQHLHEEGVDGRVADQLEEEQVLEALEADGAECR